MTRPPLLLAALTLLTATAPTVLAAPAAPNRTTPAPSPPPHPAANRCAPTGDVILQLAVRPEGDVKVETSTANLYASGAWTFAALGVDGKPGRQAAGCLAPTVLRQITADLARATWTVTPNPMVCDALASSHTDVSTRGVVKWTERQCPSEQLDPTSAKAVAEMTRLFAAAYTVATPPCCKP
jgi:hypothetical protein